MKQGIRQIDVALMLGLASSDRISHWGKGLALPSVINLFKISAIYGVRAEDLYPDLSTYEDLGSNPFPMGLETFNRSD
jgi:transcriptional regulator with XRE-family HTH domain